MLPAKEASDRSMSEPRLHACSAHCIHYRKKCAPSSDGFPLIPSLNKEFAQSDPESEQTPLQGQRGACLRCVAEHPSTFPLFTSYATLDCG